jgi:hypothetical protein
LRNKKNEFEKIYKKRFFFIELHVGIKKEGKEKLK